MVTNPVKEKLASGGSALGAFVNIGSPVIVELLALAGMDYVVLDGEHTTLGPESAENMYRAAEARGIVPITRVGQNDPQVIQKFMDAGSAGIQMPLVNNREECQRFVDSVKYPPVGKRGLAAVRAAGYGLAGPLDAYVAQANDATLIIPQIETTKGFENVEEVLSVKGVDVLFLGPTDISVALGYPGQVLHPEVLSLIEKFTAQANAAGKAAGTIARDYDEYVYWKERGVRYFLGSAAVMLGRAASDYAKRFKEVEG
jgi:4-hydroxy-2-oxoheptanedioate aldolase